MIGVAITAVGKGVLEGYYNLNSKTMTGVFPFLGVDWLPPLDCWIVTGVPAAVYYVSKNPKVKAVALGGVLYGVGMLVATSVTRWMGLGRKAGILEARAPLGRAPDTGAAQFPGGLIVGDAARSIPLQAEDRNWQGQASVWQSGPNPYQPILLV
mgnify:FL=1